MPAFNAERTLARTLRALRRQRIRRWEAVVIDDGSTDATFGLAAAWSGRDPRIRVLRQQNGGPSAARNAGLAHASGTYVAFVDADDTIAPSYISRMLRAIARAGGADGACCGSQRLSRTGRVIEQSRPVGIDIDLSASCRQMVPAPLHALFVRRSAVIAIGSFEAMLGAHEDWDFWARLGAAGIRIAREDAPLVHYWCRAGSLTRNGPFMIRTYRAARARVRQFMPPEDPAIEDDERRQALASSLAWNAGMAIGQRIDPAAVLAAAFEDKRLRGRIDAARLGSSFLGGLAVGAEQPLSELADAWGGFATGCKRFFAAFEMRSGSAGLGYGLQKACEREVIRAARPRRRTRRLARSVGLPLLSLALLRGLDVGPGRDSLVITVPGAWRTLSVPVFGEHLAAATLRARVVQGGMAELARSLAQRRETRAERALAAADAAVRPLARRLRAKISRLSRRAPARRAGANAATATAVAPPGDASAAVRFRSSGEPAGDRIMRDEQAAVARSGLAAAASRHVPRSDEAGRSEPGEATTALWDDFYAEPDPWDYDTPYERLKYDRTLAILPATPIGRTLELACAEGRFTERLAARVEHLCAADISAVALERAAARCARFPNVDYKIINFFDDEIGTDWDLITCCEVLYYMHRVEQLHDFARRAASALAPGGHLVHAHGLSVDDDPARSGFDWQVPFGAETIARVLGDRPELTLVRSLRTPLYRIDLFRRNRDGEDGLAATGPEVTSVQLGSTLEPRVARQVIWNGAVRTRAGVRTERAFRIPVLMYHRIADTGPDALASYRVPPAEFERQLLFLRRRGFRSVSLAEWREAQRGLSFEGRPVLITFDDAYTDFHEAAWPLLRRADFGAHVFVPTDKVGGCADWDSDAGEPAAIMSWDQIGELAAGGITFGSHLASHPAADCLAGEALLREAVRSRAALERVLGVEVTSVAAPFGATDSRTDGVFRIAGFREGFRAYGGPARVLELGLATPRIEISGGLDLHAFAERLGVDVEPPDAGDEMPV